MPNFKKLSDAPEGELTVITPAGDVVVPASGSVTVDETVAAELRLAAYVVETAEDAPKAPAKESK